MKQTTIIMWAAALGAMAGTLVSCGIDMPKETQTSYETLTVKKQDITVPIKFSAKLKGQTDVTITPQVSGQLVRISVTEGQQVKRGQTLFVIAGCVAVGKLCHISLSHGFKHSHASACFQRYGSRKRYGKYALSHNRYTVVEDSHFIRRLLTVFRRITQFRSQNLRKLSAVWYSCNKRDSEAFLQAFRQQASRR